MMTTPTWRRLVFEKAERIALVDRLLTSLVRPGDVVLDLACGHGYAAAIGAERGARLAVGADRLHAYLAGHARRTAAIMEARVCHVAADAYALPFRSGSFDLVWSANFLYALFAPWHVIAEIRRVLRPGGRWIGIERAVPAWRCRRERARMANPGYECEQPWRLRDWRALARVTGARLSMLPGRRVRSQVLRRWLTVARPGRVVLEIAA